MASFRLSNMSSIIVAALLAAGCDLDEGDLGSTVDEVKTDKKVTAKVQDGILTVLGTKHSDAITLRLRAGDSTTLEILLDAEQSSNLDFKRDKFDRIVVNGDRSQDTLRIDDSGGVFTDTESTTLEGDDGDDILLGGGGAELFIGGPGDDLVDGNRGNDLALLGAGNDTFQWDPGDGNDTIEGQDGADTLRFEGANIGENFDLSANGQRLRLFRDVAAITMDADGVEIVALRTRGGSDAVTVNDLAGTTVTQVDLDISGETGDGVPDRVTINATAGADSVAISGQASAVTVSGLAAATSVSHGEPGLDVVTLQLLGGDDTVNASAQAADSADVVMLGGDGADVLVGGDADDVALGGRGNDVALLGGGDDTFTWNPGDGNDVVEGQAGADTIHFNGANIGENIDLSANGQRVRLFRDVAAITMDADGVEDIELDVVGGADTVNVADLSATALAQLHVDLSALGGGGDGVADHLNVAGSAGNDVIEVVPGATGLIVQGLPAVTTIVGLESIDSLDLQSLAGDDSVTASSVAAGVVNLTILGGAGDDVLIGSNAPDVLIGDDGSDLVLGRRGDDFLLLGAGDDDTEWNPGDGNDTVEGQQGVDTLRFTGANIGEGMSLSANGTRMLLSRNVANITIDGSSVEVVDIRMLGGADTFIVDDLTPTSINSVHIDLADLAGAADDAPDQVMVSGTAGDDAIVVSGDVAGVNVTGVAAAVLVTGAGAALDTLTINGLAGNDSLDASGLAAGAIQLVVVDVP